MDIELIDHLGLVAALLEEHLEGLHQIVIDRLGKQLVDLRVELYLTQAGDCISKFKVSVVIDHALGIKTFSGEHCVLCRDERFVQVWPCASGGKAHIVEQHAELLDDARVIALTHDEHNAVVAQTDVIVGVRKDAFNGLLRAELVPDPVEQDHTVFLRHIDAVAQTAAIKVKGILPRRVEPLAQKLKVDDVAHLARVLQIRLVDHALAHRLGNGGQALNLLVIAEHQHRADADILEKQRRRRHVAVYHTLVIELAGIGLLNALLCQRRGAVDAPGVRAGKDDAVLIAEAHALRKDLHQLQDDAFRLRRGKIDVHACILIAPSGYASHRSDPAGTGAFSDSRPELLRTERTDPAVQRPCGSHPRDPAAGTCPAIPLRGPAP